MSRCGRWGMMGLIVAWILWIHMTSPTGPEDEWSIGDGFETKGACEHYRDEFLNELGKLPGHSVTDRVVRYRREDGQPIQDTFYCLPDTIDPRQPKR